MRVVSVATADMWPQCRVMARSLRRHHPGWSIEVVLVGRLSDRQPQEPALEVMSAQELLGVNAEELLALHEPDTLVSLLVPHVLRARAHSAPGPLVHLPATAWILHDLVPLAAQLEHSSIVLVPRSRADPPDDGLAPSAAAVRTMGRIATDLMAVDGSGPAEAFLSWWIKHLERSAGGTEGRRRGRMAHDQILAYRSLELAPTLFSAANAEEPGCDLSIWNFHEHTLSESAEGILVDGATPLRLINLEGFNPERPYLVSPLSTRMRPSRAPLLRPICERYADELLAAGWADGRHRAEIGRRLGSGIVYDEALERMHAQAQMLGEDFGDVFCEPGTSAFMAWLTGPAPRGAVHGVNRYVFHRVMRERADVLASFPDLDRGDGPGLVAWCRTYGQHEMDIAPQLLPESPVTTRKLSNGAPRLDLEAPASAANRPGQLPAAAVDGAPLGVRVTGFMGHVLGLGSAARGYASALSAAGVPLSTVSVTLDHVNAPVLLAADYARHSYEDVLAEGGHAFELVCVNPDELPLYVERLGQDYFQGRRIGVWGWEVNTIPLRWRTAFSLVEEIWTYSRFVAENIAAVADVPVLALPPPVETRADVAPSRLELPDGFLFLFIFDYLSTVQRKNPIGLIEAFKRAFEPGVGPRLLIKTINAPLRPFDEEALLWAAEERPDIHVIDRSLSSEQKDSLIAGCDCYVSLHRSEGFGLTLAEAMAIGKPVIGTRYSGNVDFMNDENSFLVDYELTRVGADCEIYPAEAQWAEPSIEHAAALIRRVFDDPAHASRIGERAREDIARKLSPETTGAAMRARLQELAKRERNGALPRRIRRMLARI